MLSSDPIFRAVSFLNNKRVIAYPTEAVFSLGCDPDSEEAVLRLLMLKQRPFEKGLILIAAHYEQCKSYIDDSMLTQLQRNKIFSTWPGPVTFTFPALSTAPGWLTGRFNSIAIRVTDHPLVIKLCKAFKKPLISTSANLTGSQPCRTVNEVRKQFGSTFPIIVGKTGGRQNLSEIRDALTGECFRKG